MRGVFELLNVQCVFLCYAYFEFDYGAFVIVTVGVLGCGEDCYDLGEFAFFFFGPRAFPIVHAVAFVLDFVGSC